MKLEKKGLRGLKEEVLNRNLCTQCGACVCGCPYVHLGKGHIATFASCGVETGRCYNWCPRTATDWGSLYESVWGKFSEDPLGPHTDVYRARMVPGKISAPVQYGGAVTAILIQALRTKVIEGAIVSDAEGVRTIPKLATTEEQIRKAAGSKFAVGPTVAEVNQQLRSTNLNLGVVALPCQVAAIRQMQASGLESSSHRVKLIVGLFCTWGLDQTAFSKYIGKKIGSETIIKSDIPPPPAREMKVQTDKKMHRFPLDEVKECVMPSCGVCTDMVAELSDIAIGAVEGNPGWSTVIVRSKLGKAVFDELLNCGLMEKENLGATALEPLAKAATGKRRAGQQNDV